mgnify:CR=1 FL=1
MSKKEKNIEISSDKNKKLKAEDLNNVSGGQLYHGISGIQHAFLTGRSKDKKK